MAPCRLIVVLVLPVCVAFQHPNNVQCRRLSRELVLEAEMSRRSLLVRTTSSAVASVATALVAFSPSSAVAGIDVSGLRSADDGIKNNAVADQLRSYDGSSMARAQALQTAQQERPTFRERVAAESASKDADIVNDQSSGIAATYAYRYAPGFAPRLSKAGNYGERFRCDDQLVSPSGKGYLSISFEFPSDWLQLDRLLGGVQYVDQRNGDKLYILRTKLPPDTTIVNVPKKFFGDAIFDPQGTLARSGITVEEYKLKSSVTLSDGLLSAPHRRLLFKYSTVTGNGLSTERRALVDVYQIDSEAYMLMTSSNAVKFDAMGRERDTVEAIVDSFRIEKIA